MTDMDPLARLRAVADTDEHPDARFGGELRRRMITAEFDLRSNAERQKNSQRLLSWPFYSFRNGSARPREWDPAKSRTHLHKRTCQST